MFISESGPPAGAISPVKVDPITASLLQTLRDPTRIARAKEQDERIKAEQAEQDAWRECLPADPDTAAIIEVAAEVCNRVAAHVCWHCIRATERDLPLCTSAHFALGDVLFHVSQLRDTLPDADDDTLRTMFRALFQAIRRIRSAEEDAWLLKPNLTREQWRSQLETYNDLELNVAMDQVCEIGEGDLLVLTSSLGAVLELLRNARAGFEPKLIDADDTEITFAEFPLTAADAWRRAISILAHDSPSAPPQVRSGVAQWG